MRTRQKKNSARRLLAAAMPERWTQVCRVKITFESILNYWFVSTKTHSMKYFENWIPLNTHVRFNQTLPWTPKKAKSSSVHELQPAQTCCTHFVAHNEQHRMQEIAQHTKDARKTHAGHTKDTRKRQHRTRMRTHHTWWMSQGTHEWVMA